MIRANSRAGALAFVWTSVGVALGCAANSRPADAGTASGRAEFRYLYIEGAYHCDGPHDPELQKLIEHQRRDLTAALGIDDPPLTTVSEVERALAADDARPLVVVFVGHGTNRHSVHTRPRSEICLDGGRLALDCMLGTVHPSVPYTVLVVDACFSAHVDVRAAGTAGKAERRSAVLSAGSREVPAGSDGGTAMGDTLVHAFRCGDANADGLIDDLELLEAIRRSMGDDPRLAPRLRRQNWVPLSVLRVRPGGASAALAEAPCRAQAPSDDLALEKLIGPELFAVERRFRASPRWAAEAPPYVFWGVSGGESAWVQPEGATSVVQGPSMQLRTAARLLRATRGFALSARADQLDLRGPDWSPDAEEILSGLSPAEAADVVWRLGRGAWATLEDGHLWHAGFVGGRIETLDGTRIDGRRLTPVVCPEAFGQCFDLGSDADPKGMHDASPNCDRRE